LRIWFVLDEAWRSKPLDRLFVAISAISVAGLATASVGSAFLFATATSTISAGFAARHLGAKGLCCIKDWSISCTPTEVAIESLLNFQF